MSIAESKHQEFEIGFIWWALGIAIFGGFMLGAHIAMQLGFGMGLPKALDVWIQVHGHLQLIGWAGLFIIGVSLHFLPRRVGVPIENKNTLKIILYLTAVGLITRANFEFWQPYIGNELAKNIFKYIANLGNIAEFLGINLYTAVLVKIFLRAPGHRIRSLNILSPFIVAFIVGWIIYSLVQVSATFLQRYEWIVWNSWSIDLFMNLTLFSISFIFSIFNFPSYILLRLPPASIKYVGYFFFVATILYAIFSLPSKTRTFQVSQDLLGLLIDIAIVLFLFLTGIVQRIFIPKRALTKSPVWGLVKNESKELITSKRPREGYSDYGEFGRFELLIYSAYLWLIFGLFLDVIRRSGSLLGLSVYYGIDPIRHSYFAGFISLLIMGMAQRMLPGFMRKSKIANSKIVLLTFVFGNIAVLFRVAPMLVPPHSSELVRAIGQVMLYLFGISGFIAIFSVILLSINLYNTYKMR